MNETYGLAATCMRHMHTIHRLMETYAKCTHSPTFADLTLLQLQVVLLVQEKGKVMMKELAETLCVKPPSITPLVRRLVKKNMIEKVPGEEDKRKIYVHLTEHAKLSLEEVFAEKIQVMTAMLSVINKSDQKQLLSLLQRIEEGLSKNIPLV